MSFAPEFGRDSNILQPQTTELISCTCRSVVMSVMARERVVDNVLHRRLPMPCHEIDVEVVSEPKPLSHKEIEVRRRAEVNADGSISMYVFEVLNPPNVQAERVLMDILPNAMSLYLKKSRDYGDGSMDDALKLGARAQFVDMWRKIKKLKRALWDGETMHDEGVQEIVMDFIGHSLLVLLDYLPITWRVNASGESSTSPDKASGLK